MTAGIPKPVSPSARAAFDLSGRVAVVTGGGGLLGIKHAEALAEFGAIPVLLDLEKTDIRRIADDIGARFKVQAAGLTCDITDETQVAAVKAQVLSRFGRIDILINNAAHNPKVEDGSDWTRLENFPLEAWNRDIAVGLTGALIGSRVFGAEMARAGRGVILNVASDLGLIAPDQRIYADPGLDPAGQPVKPVSYSVVKAGLIGLTRYLATYWPDRGVRANALAPGGVYAKQDAEFVERLASRIPMGRMAHQDEYKGAVVFMVSDASSYMNGAVLSVDGGRTVW